VRAFGQWSADEEMGNTFIWPGASSAVAAIGLALAGDALGSGFQLRENSASALGNAFASGAVSTEDPSVIANNPAGMVGLSGNQLSGDLSIIIPSAVFSGTGVTAAKQPISGGNGGNAGSAQPVPAAYGFYDASSDLKLGLAVTAPFGLKGQYRSDWVGRYQAIKSDIEIININPNIAYRISDWLSVGGGPAIQYADAELPTPSIRRRLCMSPVRCCRQD
jgi:long-chain fatty acid transport protein